MPKSNDQKRATLTTATPGPERSEGPDSYRAYVFDLACVASGRICHSVGTKSESSSAWSAGASGAGGIRSIAPQSATGRDVGSGGRIPPPGRPARSGGGSPGGGSRSFQYSRSAPPRREISRTWASCAAHLMLGFKWSSDTFAPGGDGVCPAPEGRKTLAHG